MHNRYGQEKRAKQEADEKLEALLNKFFQDEQNKREDVVE